MDNTISENTLIFVPFLRETETAVYYRPLRHTRNRFEITGCPILIAPYV